MLDAFRMTADGILILSGSDNSCHTDKQQSFEESFEEIICVDDP